MNKKLLALSFIEGATVMAAELCGAKLLAPYFGSSLNVWASVMAITLAALALGYFYGGHLSTAKSPIKTLFIILSCASLFTILSPLLAKFLLVYFGLFPIFVGILCGCILLLFPAIFFLGASSPLFVLLQSNYTNAGKAGGTVYAISTAGGIIATFLCGFLLIPSCGLTITLLIFGSTLFISTCLFLNFFKINTALIFCGIMFCNISFTCNKNENLLTQDGVMGKLEVYEEKNNSGEIVRKLSVNKIVQTEMNLKTKKSVSQYINILDSVVQKSNTVKNALVLGLGGGLTSNLLCEKNYKVDAVEFDARIAESAKNYFFLNATTNVFCEDARYFLNKTKNKYDLVLIDVFKAEEQPNHILTKESLIQLNNNLNKNALVFINWHGYIDGEIGLGTHVLLNTLKETGFNTKLITNNNNPDTRNLLIVAGKEPLPLFKNELCYTVKSECNKINTDDLPILEFYNNKANLTWRKNYLKYYFSKN